MLFVSDIHGSITALEQVLFWFKELGCKQLISLGDLLNHGPRNPIPEGYNPSQVAERLNDMANQIIAIRGNCDSEVDQMLCRFPIMADYNWLVIGGRRLCLSHGHLLGPENLPPLKPGDGFIYGHTHVAVAEWLDGVMHFNPGSITFPKGSQVASFGHFDGQRFKVLDFNGYEIKSASWYPKEL